MMKDNTNEYNNFKELIDESKTDLLGYVDKQIQLFKLKAYEKIASSVSFLLYTLMTVVFGLIFFILLLIGVGITLGQALNDYSLGFGILILFVLILFIVILLLGKKVRRTFVNLTIRTIKKIESDEI